MLVEFLIKKLSYSARARLTLMHHAFVAPRVANDLLDQVFVCQLPVPCNTATQHFDEHYSHKESESFLSQPEHTIWVSRYRTLRTQYLHLGFFSLKAVYNSCKLQRLLKVTNFLLMYSFTHTNMAATY